MKKTIEDYKNSLIEEQLSERTIKKYLKESKDLEDYLKDKELTKKNLISYLDFLKDKKLSNNTLNNKIICINKYIKFKADDINNNKGLALKNIKTQGRELPEAISQVDFNRILRQARQKGTDRDILMLQVFLYTGLRVSELKYFTVESLKHKYMEVENKGKFRKVPLIPQIVKLGKEYAKKNNISKGSIILSNQGNPLGRTTIFKRLKYLGGQARVKKNKVYPHSIRHLFAKNYLDNGGDVVRLADILGHSSLETTRIYTKLGTNELRDTIKYLG